MGSGVAVVVSVVDVAVVADVGDSVDCVAVAPSCGAVVTAIAAVGAGEASGAMVRCLCDHLLPTVPRSMVDNRPSRGWRSHEEGSYQSCQL